MTLPPTAAEQRARRRMLLELELAHILRRIERLELAQSSPIAWLALNIGAMALELDTPAAELARLWFAEALLEASLAWHEREGA